MKRTQTALLVAGLVMLAYGCLQIPGKRNAGSPIYVHHFLGLRQVLQDTNAGKLKAAFSTPSAAALRNDLLGKFAKTPANFWRKDLPAGVSDQQTLFRPLFEDLFSAESFLQVKGSTDRPDAVLAVQVPDARAKLWNSNLLQVAKSWQLGIPGPLPELPGGWEVKWKGNILQFASVRDWVLVGFGRGQLSGLSTAAAQVRQTGRPVAALGGKMLDLEAEFPELQKWFPLLTKWSLPPAHCTIAGKGGSLRSEVRLRYGGPLGWKPEPWRIPVNTVSDPLISFTVARGIGPILQSVPAIKELGLKEFPNQFCQWGLASEFAVTFLTVPTADPTNTMNRIAPRLPVLANRYMPKHLGDFLWVSNKADFMWQGLPFIVPHLRPLQDGGQGYLLGSLFPMLPRTNAAPSELYKQFMKRDDVAYYDWEITAERLTHAKQFHQLYNIANELRIAGTNVPIEKWLDDIRGIPGNTVTEITVENPSELQLVRRSDLGFTAFELASLARWIESPPFPLGYEPPPPLRRTRPDLPGKTNATVRSRSNTVSRPGPVAPPAKPGATPAKKP